MDKLYPFVWPQGKPKALTFSYDDGVEQDRRLLDMMRKNGIKGTFNLNSGYFDPKAEQTTPHDYLIRGNGAKVAHFHIPGEEVAKVYEGMEVAVHTVTHPYLNHISEAQALWQVLADRDALEKAVGYPVRGLAYPVGGYSKRVMEMLAECGIVYARVVPVSNNFDLPQENLAWECSCHHNGLEAMIDPFLKEAKPGALLSVWGHSYEFDYDERCGWDKIEEDLQRLGGHDDVWYATNMEVFSYIQAWKDLQYTIDATCVQNLSALDVWLNVRGNIVHVPSGAIVRL